jgi:hypothetical protein
MVGGFDLIHPNEAGNHAIADTEADLADALFGNCD